MGRTYPLNPLRGRDDNGPIFPVGDVDPRLPVHDVVLGVAAPDGKALAFPRVAVQLALSAGETVRLEPIQARNWVVDAWTLKRQIIMARDGAIVIMLA